MRPRSLLKALPSDRRGAAMIEFSLVLPLLVLLMCGLAELGWALRQFGVMQKGVRDAARYMSRVSGACGTGSPSAAWTTAVGQAKELAVYGKAGGAKPLHRGWTDLASVTVNVACISNTGATPAWRGPSALPVVTVTATAAYTGFGLFSAIGLTAPTLSVAHQELVVAS